MLKSKHSELIYSIFLKLYKKSFKITDHIGKIRPISYFISILNQALLNFTSIQIKPIPINFKVLEFVKRRYEHIYQHLKQYITQGRVIDCACGYGDGSLIFIDKGFNVKSYDIDNLKIEISKRKKINAFLGDITSLPEDDNSVDIFISSETLEHLSRKESIIAANEIKRIVKKNGLIAITVPEDEKICMSLKTHKQYISYNDLKNIFGFTHPIHRGLFCSKPNRYNLVVIFKNSE